MRTFTLSCILLLVVTLPLLADGVPPVGSGTEADPYQIATLDNLLWLSTTDSALTCHYIQTADIDASDTQNWNDGEGFRCIGRPNYPFSGVYNGQNHAITGLWMVDDLECLGMFFLDYGTVRNLCLMDAYIDSDRMQIGGISGYCRHGTITNCHVTGYVHGNYQVGGIVGDSFYNTVIDSCSSSATVCSNSSGGGVIGYIGSSTITNCYASGCISGGNYMGGIFGGEGDNTIAYCNSACTVNGAYAVGGICGMSTNSDIHHCGNTGSITGISCVGGIAGDFNDSGTLDACVNYATVQGTRLIGGLTGRAYEAGPQIMNSTNNGSVIGEEQVGGLVGYTSWYTLISDCYNTASVEGTDKVGGLLGDNWMGSIIQCCYNIGTVSGDTNVGGCLGLCDTSTSVTACFWDMETSGISVSAAGTGLTTAEMQVMSTYVNAGWDFIGETTNGTNDYWGINPEENSGYPFLAWEGYTHNPPQSAGSETDAPAATTLLPNFPNPFNPSTTIAFSVAPGQRARLEVFNLRGQHVRGWEEFPAGQHAVRWNGTDDAGQSVASGVYFSRLTSDEKTQTRKMLLLK